jgi:hypothetical protein
MLMEKYGGHTEECYLGTIERAWDLDDNIELFYFLLLCWVGEHCSIYTGS